MLGMSISPLPRNRTFPFLPLLWLLMVAESKNMNMKLVFLAIYEIYLTIFYILFSLIVIINHKLKYLLLKIIGLDTKFTRLESMLISVVGLYFNAIESSTGSLFGIARDDVTEYWSSVPSFSFWYPIWCNNIKQKPSLIKVLTI